MKALCDPNRVKIFKMLQERSLCVCEMQAALDIAQPTVSSHLKVLEDAGLVYSRKTGLWVNYLVFDGSRSPYVAALLGNLKHWLKDDPEIVRILEALATLRRGATNDHPDGVCIERHSRMLPAGIQIFQEPGSPPKDCGDDG